MKIGIFDPYLATLGGGEKYILDIARCLASEHSVYLFWDKPSILNEAKERFGKNYSNINITKNIFQSRGNLIERYSKTKGYDIIFYLSDGSIPFLFAKKNILLFQFPVPWVRINFLSALKLKKIHKIICYSGFVKSFLDSQFGVNSQVLPPMVNINHEGVKKENIILSVGRFTKGMNRKKQEILINLFKLMCDKGLNGWRLVLIGSSLPSGLDFTKSLKASAKNYPIEIIVNAPYGKLLSYYGRAKIYWHAAGYGEDLLKHPEYAEHFGISTIEAMGAGAVPVVINAGGQKEIVENNVSGFLWSSENEFIEKTEKLIKDPDLLSKMSKEAVKRSKGFGEDRFCREVKELL